MQIHLSLETRDSRGSLHENVQPPGGGDTELLDVLIGRVQAILARPIPTHSSEDETLPLRPRRQTQ